MNRGVMMSTSHTPGFEQFPAYIDSAKVPLWLAVIFERDFHSGLPNLAQSSAPILLLIVALQAIEWVSGREMRTQLA